MDTISKLYLRIAELEGQIENYVDDNTPEFIPDAQEELDNLTKKLTHLQSSTRKHTKKKASGDLFS